MATPDVGPSRIEDREQLSSREFFLKRFSSFVSVLSDVEAGLPTSNKDRLDQINTIITKYLEKDITELPIQEGQLLRTIYGLWSLKNDIPQEAHLPELRPFVSGKGLQELSMEMGGPIASAKSTLARFLADEIGAKVEEERFDPSGNPFLDKAYKDPGYMLRTQVKFLLDNILVGLRGKFYEGRWVRDTSVLSDIHVFMEWRRRAGIVTEEEHKAYMDVVRLLKPLITKPDLLILLVPNSGERLMEGLWERIKDNPEERKMEEGISQEDLDICIQATKDAAAIIREEFGIQVHVLEIDPVEVYKEPSLRYAAVYKIREQLGLLKELLLKDPNKVAADIVKIFATSHEPQVVIVHSPSMFTGKTSTLNCVAEMVGREKVVSFQPAAALRYGEEHIYNMIDRDGRKIPAFTTQSNRLRDILTEIDQRGMTPREHPLIFIDEVMFYTESSSEEAIGVIEDLRSRGFNVICDGIDYTFQEEPFTFSHELVARSFGDGNWHEIELATRCKYCDKQARGTRRLTPDGSIADFSDTAYQAGDNYEPVCCDRDKSCVGQPKDFQRKSIEVTEPIPERKGPRVKITKNNIPEYEARNKESVEISKNISLWVDTAVRILQDTGDFDAFFSSMVEFYEDLKRTYNHDDQRVHPFVLLTPLTDLIEEEWPEGNTAIIRGAEKLGITPHPNYNGKRLRATNVLAEILVKSKL
ncbi:hypothetical protein A2985_00460 [Candidatus Woesebacteria bacterium RIFCSPLOWO2_01_FULL_43_11]|nr:MAG: hypothetical protein A2985_00460 [Candidatus Woesebacteria bacterium RIFCSPLOWO2_01_FULL_43_11]